MSGLNFFTQTIINSKENKFSKSKINKDLIQDSSTRLDAEGNKLPSGVDCMRIGNEFAFEYDKIQSVKVGAPYEAQLAEAVVDFTKMIDAVKPSADEKLKYNRLDLYIRWEGAAPYIGADHNEEIHKGLPFWVEFSVSADDTAKTVAAKVADLFTKHHVTQVDKDLIDVVDNGDGTLTLTATQEFIRFYKIEVSSFTLDAEYNDVVAVLKGVHGAVPAESETANGEIKIVTRGMNSFGTYDYILRNLRLPTAEHNRWEPTLTVETPILGAMYKQYIINYCDNAVNDGWLFVGQRGTSTTTHVFWVLKDANGEVEDAMNAVLANVDADKISGVKYDDAEDKLVTVDGAEALAL